MSYNSAGIMIKCMEHKYIVKLSRNVSQLVIDNEWDNVNNNNIEEIEEIEEENIRGRERGRRRDRDRGRSRSRGRDSNSGSEQIKIIVKNTNTYAYIKNGEEGCKWKELTTSEFRIWLAIVIYVDCTTPSMFWYSNLATHIQTVFKSICIPLLNLSVDKIIVRFSGRSAHTMDNGSVTMLSTIYQINRDENQIARVRYQPQETSTNATKIQAIFESVSKKSLPISVVIDDYNHFIGRVNIADQLQRYYSTQLANLIKVKLEKEEQHIHTRSQVDELTNQFKFIQVDPSKKQQYVTVNFELPLIRLSPVPE
ncbi:hypothetical protein C1646_759668 [Rhizophagus diaphanus]|nr:hypothetical protein C1646_759668 [Rhizophagus diaphanus] [Rhizophagus sp. MUCL 43196]